MSGYVSEADGGSVDKREAKVQTIRRLLSEFYNEAGGVGPHSQFRSKRSVDEDSRDTTSGARGAVASGGSFPRTRRTEESPRASSFSAGGLGCDSKNSGSEVAFSNVEGLIKGSGGCPEVAREFPGSSSRGASVSRPSTTKPGMVEVGERFASLCRAFEVQPSAKLVECLVREINTLRETLCDAVTDATKIIAPAVSIDIVEKLNERFNDEARLSSLLNKVEELADLIKGFSKIENDNGCDIRKLIARFEEISVQFGATKAMELRMVEAMTAALESVANDKIEVMSSKLDNSNAELLKAIGGTCSEILSLSSKCDNQIDQDGRHGPVELSSLQSSFGQVDGLGDAGVENNGDERSSGSASVRNGKRAGFIAAARRAAGAVPELCREVAKRGYCDDNVSGKNFGSRDHKKSHVVGYSSHFWYVVAAFVVMFGLVGSVVAIVTADGLLMSSSSSVGDMAASAAPEEMVQQVKKEPADAHLTLGKGNASLRRTEQELVKPTSAVSVPTGSQKSTVEDGPAPGVLVAKLEHLRKNANKEEYEARLKQSFGSPSLAGFGKGSWVVEDTMVAPPDLIDKVIARDAVAAFEIGLRYAGERSTVDDVNVDPRKAITWYRRAAESGFAPAQFRLASALERGLGRVRNLNEAKFWYQAAAEKGHIRAMHNVAVIYANEGSFSSAFIWFQRAAEYGLQDSQFNLGVLYSLGKGVERDFAAAYNWFSIAANLGDREAIERRTEIEKQLDRETLYSVKMSVRNWEPLRVNKFVNEEITPWSDQVARR